MSGELLKESIELSSNTGHQAGTNVSLAEVTEVYCPTYISDKRDLVELGRLTHFEYYSEATKCNRGANILLPSNYDDTKKYPVLYFLHGIFGDEYSMIGDPNNKIDVIVANLKADNIIDDIIVVFPNMFASSDPDLEPGFTSKQTAPYDYFINDLVGDLIPYIEGHYSVSTNKKDRGLIGFSMGGRETLFIGLQRSDLFEAICSVSAAPGLVPSEDYAMKHDGQMREEDVRYARPDNPPKFLMLTCGTKDSVVGSFPANYDKLLTKNGVDHIWYEVPEADHDSNAIRSGLYNMLIRWFN